MTCINTNNFKIRGCESIMTIEELAIKLQEVVDIENSNRRRITDIEKKLEDNAAMLSSIARLDQRQKDMDTDIKEIKVDVKAMASKPGKRWEGLVDKALLTIVALLLTYTLARLGLA